jgi:hypothetical protein
MIDYAGRTLHVGQKVRIETNIPTADGMLHANTIVTVDAVGFPDKDLRVIDKLGKIWFVNATDVSASFL